MDDICYSEDTVQETQHIVEDSERILKNGGFSMKNWLSNKLLTLVNEDPNKEEIKAFHATSSGEDNVMGIEWINTKDTLSLRVCSYLLKLPQRMEEIKLMNRRLLQKWQRFMTPLDWQLCSTFAPTLERKSSGECVSTGMMSYHSKLRQSWYNSWTKYKSLVMLHLQGVF